ncbi:hypothetical protein NKR23_g1511 [Pleurostoma richardsiae]|uniref:Ubiquitin 3 binding protein But2 C-terminal domain-containing protein n=1 Tax=Pleurostoma richardsiae TaxID=41990 RepID=A0AA38S4E2_9PEZI|nr:hypothetical protein NKR23_g1511 [Pleurostoma richardsiae]
MRTTLLALLPYLAAASVLNFHRPTADYTSSGPDSALPDAGQPKCFTLEIRSFSDGETMTIPDSVWRFTLDGHTLKKLDPEGGTCFVDPEHDHTLDCDEHVPTGAVTSFHIADENGRDILMSENQERHWLFCLFTGILVPVDDSIPLLCTKVSLDIIPLTSCLNVSEVPAEDSRAFTADNDQSSEPALLQADEPECFSFQLRDPSDQTRIPLVGDSMLTAKFTLDKHTLKMMNPKQGTCFVNPAAKFKLDCDPSVPKGAMDSFKVTNKKENDHLKCRNLSKAGWLYCGEDGIYLDLPKVQGHLRGCQKVDIAIKPQKNCSGGQDDDEKEDLAPTHTRMPTILDHLSGHDPSHTDIAGLLQVRQTPATPSCSVSLTAASLAPIFVYDGAPNQTSFMVSQDRVAHITSTRSTVFGFSLPPDFPPASSASASRTCALQFRMPYCSELPAGYPCYQFSGMEQEVLSNSGMYYRRVLNSGETTTYEDIGLVQAFPGNNITIATFDCGPGSPTSQGNLMWLADSVKNFQLEFLQGGGPSGYEGGVGAFIVACS